MNGVPPTPPPQIQFSLNKLIFYEENGIFLMRKKKYIAISFYICSKFQSFSSNNIFFLQAQVGL